MKFELLYVYFSIDMRPLENDYRRVIAHIL